MRFLCAAASVDSLLLFLDPVTLSGYSENMTNATTEIGTANTELAGFVSLSGFAVAPAGTAPYTAYYQLILATEGEEDTIMVSRADVEDILAETLGFTTMRGWDHFVGVRAEYHLEVVVAFCRNFSGFWA